MRNWYDLEVTQKVGIENNKNTWAPMTCPEAVPHYKEFNNFAHLLATDPAHKYAGTNLL